MSASALADVVDMLDPDDFHTPVMAQAWDAMKSLARTGRPVDVITVVREMGAGADVGQTLIEATAGTPAIANAGQYAQIIATAALQRRTIMLAAELSDAMYAGTDDPELLIRQFGPRIETGLRRLAGGRPVGLTAFGAFAELSDDELPEWVVPDWIRRQDRAMIVAAEGSGKSVLVAQIAAAVAHGINPWWPDHKFLPSHTLMIDAENPAYAIRERAQWMRRAVERSGREWMPDAAQVLHRPAGIDLRDRATRVDIEQALAELKPTLVVLSPLYRSYSIKANETHEDAATAVQRILDDLRVRYDFALIVEHHAPGKATKDRDMVPAGSSLWQRWAEFGIALLADKDGRPDTIRVGRFRPDRVKSPGWPSTITHGQPWPWTGAYPNGSPWFKQQRMPDTDF